MQKLILGTVQLGISYGINNTTGKPSEAEAFAILENARHSGITILDTAEGYGNAIEIIADFHKRQSPFEIITKFVYKTGLDVEAYVATLLQKLNIKQIHALMLHKYQDMVTYPELLALLNAEKQKGTIRYVGVSLYTNEEFEACIHNPLVDVIQLPFNVLDNYHKRGSLLKLAKSNNKIIHTRSAFLQGLFFKDPDTLNTQLSPLKPYLVSLNKIASEYNLTMEELALNYAIHTEEIDHVLFGVESTAQLNHNIEAVKTRFDKALYDQISSIDVKEIELLNPANWI